MSDVQPGRYQWPAGHRAALCLTFDVDGLLGEANYQPAANTYAISQAEYDERGVQRILGILADAAVDATFCWVGRVAEESPAAVRAAHAAGHEIALHTWDHRYYNGMSREEQRADMLRTRTTLEGITGGSVVGHKTAGWRYTAETFALAQEMRLRWLMDEPGGDAPYFTRVDPALPPVVQLPPSRMWDDYTFFVDQILTPQATFECWREDLDVLRDEGGLMSLTLHPFVSGRPGASRAFSRLIDYAVDLGDVWIARADHIAQWHIEQHAEAPGS